MLTSNRETRSGPLRVFGMATALAMLATLIAWASGNITSPLAQTEPVPEETTPFQVTASLNVAANAPSGEVCMPIQVPTGKVLRVDHWGAEVLNAVLQPRVTLRVVKQVGVGGSELYRMLVAPMASRSLNSWSGSTAVTAFAGQVQGGSYTMGVCVSPQSTAMLLRPFVAGYLEGPVIPGGS